MTLGLIDYGVVCSTEVTNSQTRLAREGKSVNGSQWRTFNEWESGGGKVRDVETVEANYGRPAVFCSVGRKSLLHGEPVCYWPRHHILFEKYPALISLSFISLAFCMVAPEMDRYHDH